MNILDNFNSYLSPFIEKMKKDELTLEDILNEDEIIQDIKNNNDSQFIKFFTNEKIKKLIDYSTKFPLSNEHNIGYKYPFNATEILCSDNINFQKILMSEKPLNQKQNNDIEIINRIKKNDGFLFKLFEVINNTKKELRIRENDNEKRDNIYIEDDSSDSDYSDEMEDDEDGDNNLKNNEQNKNFAIIYENIDYLLGFLKESNKTKENYVLVGYFCKILTNLINIHSIKIVQYLFNYPKKDEFDILGLLVKNMNRKSICNIIQQLLLFDEDYSSNLEEKKITLLEKIFKELNETNEKEKYECICDSLSIIMSNKFFFDLFIKKSGLLDILYDILINSKQNTKKFNSLLKLLSKINDTILQYFDSKCTSNIQENNNNDLIPFNLDLNTSNNKSLSFPEDNNSETFKNFLLTYFDVLEKNQFSFLDDLGNFNQEENGEFMSTYLEPQKKIGLKKLIQTEYIKTILDILVNSYFSGYHKKKIEKVINIANNQNIFWNLHNLFFLFPFSNIYQIYYNQIIEIILNENSPNCLIDSFLKEKIDNKNIVNIFIDKILNNLIFNFKLTNIHSLNPSFSYNITLLNKIYNSKNLYLKKIKDKDKDLIRFNEIIGKEVQEIFGQRLLLSNQGINFGDIEDQVSSFGPKNFLEILEENIKIYNAYKKGENYEEMLKGKNERIEKEKMEKEEMEKEKKKSKKIQYLEDIDDVEDPLLKIEKLLLKNEKDNFLSMLNKPTEDIYKEEEKNKMDNEVDNDDGGENKLDIKELEEDFEEKENVIVDENEREKINNENEILNEDIPPMIFENKIYHIDYNKNKLNNEEENKTENELKV